MFESLRVFEIREPIVENYVVPALDTLGLGQSTVILPPPAPIIQMLTATQITWENIQGVTNYILQSLSSGTVWATVATIAAPSSVQIIWNGSAWLIQLRNAGQWETLYIGPQPPVPFILVGDTPIAQTILTPNLIPTWYVPGDVTTIVGVSVGASVPGLTVGLGSPLDPNGMTITGAPTSQVNCSLSYPGPQNGRSSYLGPDIDTYLFSPSVGVFYRMLAENAGGFSVPSNIVELLLPSDPDIILGIEGYTDGMIANTFPNAGIDPTWDGSFPYKNSLYPNIWTGWYQSGQDDVIDGNLASVALVSLQEGGYLLQICANTSGGYAPLWSGTKSDSSTPLGIYTNDSTGTDSTPTTLTLIQLAGTPTQSPSGFLGCVPE